MGGKGGKKKKNKAKNGEKKNSVKAKGSRGKAKSAGCSVDIFNEAAMENAYTTCHNVQDLLKIRGFPWPDAQKKKKKGKK